jgi:hypothetical protein
MEPLEPLLYPQFSWLGSFISGPQALLFSFVWFTSPELQDSGLELNEGVGKTKGGISFRKF